MVLVVLLEYENTDWILKTLFQMEYLFGIMVMNFIINIVGNRQYSFCSFLNANYFILWADNIVNLCLLTS